MGLSLFNKLVCNTYPGVLKTCDNAALNATPKLITDGVGNNVPIALGTVGAIYIGSHDFTGATVTGITGAAGLVNGTGTDSMRSDVTTIAACALGTCSIALGNAAYADGCKSIAIGEGATTLCEEGITMGFGTSVSGCAGVAIGRGAAAAEYAVGLGYGASANGLRAVSIGHLTIGTGDCSVTIGCGSAARGTGSVAIGHDSETFTGVQDSVSIGRSNGVAHNQSVALGCCNFIGLICGTGTSNIGIGAVNCVEGSYNISIGSNNCVTCESAIAIGSQACALLDDTYGFFDCTGSIAIGKCAVGCQGGISMGFCATSQGQSISIGNVSKACTGAIAIGNYTEACNNQSVVIGPSAYVTATAGSAVKIGHQGYIEGGFYGTAVGYNARVCSIVGAGTAIGASSRVDGGATAGTSVGFSANTNGCFSVALGAYARADADESLALGYCVTANRASTLTTCELETCVAGKGLIVKTPDGLNSYRIAVDNSGNLTTTLV